MLDGFKSYAHRRALEDLSPHFNAITGLNGSGKSNIFDAICFVMGITNLKRMRADDPRELIYRAGTTGIHAARVTIEFINDDPATAPPGYSCEDFPIITVGRQIKVGGKQQFFLNNTVSMQSRVKRFFESISLNVDNPHFMVLQGTVHKLIGMRSMDMLSLIEEAVGTKAFDHRRRTAETLIRNKERKIQEIDENISTQIGPMLEAMKSDQEAYRRYIQLAQGLEEMRDFRRAYDFMKYSKDKASLAEKVAAVRENIEAAKLQLQELPAQEGQLTRRLVMLQEGVQGPSEDVLHLYEKEGEKKKEFSRLQSELGVAKQRLKALHAAKKVLGKEELQIVELNAACERETAKREVLALQIKEKRAEIEKLQQSLQLLESGVHASSSGLSLEEERQQLEVKRIQLEASLHRQTDALAEAQKAEQSTRDRLKKYSSQLGTLHAQLSTAKEVFETAEKSYNDIIKPLFQAHRDGEQRLVKLQDAMRIAHENFQRENNAANPSSAAASGGGGNRNFELSFDRHAASAAAACTNKNIDLHILGRVGELVVPTKDKFAKALVVGAQQQLLRVVVDHDSIAELIIRHGLRQRTSFLPLNKLDLQESYRAVGEVGGAGEGGEEEEGKAGAEEGKEGQPSGSKLNRLQPSSSSSSAATMRTNNLEKRIEQAKRLAEQQGGFAYAANELVCVAGMEDSENLPEENDTSPHSNSTSSRQKRASRGSTSADNGGSGSSVDSASLHPHHQMLRLLADNIFGSFVVCSSLSIAEKIAYTAGIRLKAVTLDGEVAEPHGVMTGGSASSIRDLFAELRAYQKRREPVRNAQAQVRQVEEALSVVQRQLRQNERIICHFRESQERWEAFQQQWEQATGGVDLEQELEQILGNIRILEEDIQKTQEEMEKVKERRQKVEGETAVDVHTAKKKLQQQLRQAELAVTKLLKEEEEGELVYDRKVAEAEERASSLQQRRQENEEEVEQTNVEMRTLQASLDAVEEELKPIHRHLEELESTRARMEKEIEEVQEDLAQLQQRRHSLDSITKNGEQERHAMQKQVDDLSRRIRDDLLKPFPWLEAAAEEGKLGDPSGPFYFEDEARTAKTLREHAEAEAHMLIMSKKIQKKSSTVLYEDRQREYNELLLQRQALGKDKEAIQACIKEIENRKWHALDRMVQVVSSVMGKLFETCIPGATAELREERDEYSHLSGLGVRVVFNGKAKESLSELSGGQRSLLALCLILAILRVRQAPIYILDEVDAALDPSHTQNIGLMLHTYFPTSQFLLISLKDGMFNSADVLFHVRNTQGYSEVTRLSQQQQQQQQ